MNKIIRAIMVLLVAGSVCEAATYYVATTGSDSNSGSQTQPWRTIVHAAQVANAGDTVFVGNGTYAESVTFGHSGSSGAAITFQSQNKWGAVIQLPSGASPGLDINGSYVTIKNFEVIGASDGSNSTGIKCNSGSNCSVIGNKVHHIGTTSSSCPLGAAIEPNNGNNETVSDNLIYDVSPPRSASFRCNHEQGIYSSTGTGQNSNGIIQNNIILDCYQCYAIQFDGGNPSGWTVTNNTIANVGDSGHSSGGGIYFNCANSGATCDNMKFNNNIFYDTGGDSCLTEAQVAPGGTMGTHNLYLNNLFSNCFGGNNFIKGSLANSVNANPLFMNYTGTQSGDYHVQASSPAVDAGTSTGAPTVDFDNITRSGGIWIGAYQGSGGTSTAPTPPTGLQAIVN